jgi:hypothetical protein
MRPSSLEFWAWTLIYAGALLLSFAAFVLEIRPPMAWLMAISGGVAMVVGVVFIWRRSRVR